MKRRSFITTLAGAFLIPRLPPLPGPGRLLLIADELNELPGFNPLNYRGTVTWINMAAAEVWTERHREAYRALQYPAYAAPTLDPMGIHCKPGNSGPTG